ncbi:hypothetical protein I3842_09G154000 [Carya illinoinensis]|uniref:Uncharacterized protein n=1 Tax=Carya illinoinensis TaxID=32201 RepID=A0A922E4E8_CARIL|nr:hypothetical protein I3842_09G154000 [Carya illinoinensis]
MEINMLTDLVLRRVSYIKFIPLLNEIKVSYSAGFVLFVQEITFKPITLKLLFGVEIKSLIF